MSDQKPKSTIVVLTRERFEAIPSYRARYIGLYILIFFVWAGATLTGLYYERVQVPIERTADVSTPDASAPEEAAPAEPEFRTEYRWKWTPPVQIFQAAMIAGMIAFYVYFTRVLALMGYPLPMIIGYCAAVFFPVPGLLAVALVDRQIAKTWNKAEDAFLEADKAAREPQRRSGASST